MAYLGKIGSGRERDTFQEGIMGAVDTYAAMQKAEEEKALRKAALEYEKEQNQKKLELDMMKTEAERGLQPGEMARAMEFRKKLGQPAPSQYQAETAQDETTQTETPQPPSQQGAIERTSERVDPMTGMPYIEQAPTGLAGLSAPVNKQQVEKFEWKKTPRQIAKEQKEQQQSELIGYQLSAAKKTAEDPYGINETRIKTRVKQELEAPEKKREGEEKLRQEVQNLAETKAFSIVDQSFKKLQEDKADAINGNPASQMSVVYSIMKIYDPNSIVKEGEYAMAENARGVPAAILNQYNKIVEGGRLTKDQILQFDKSARNVYKGQEKNYELATQAHRNVAKKYGFDESLIFRPKSKIEPESSRRTTGSLTPEQRARRDELLRKAGN